MNNTKMNNVEIEIKKISFINNNSYNDCNNFYIITEIQTGVKYITICHLLSCVGFSQEEATFVRSLWRNTKKIANNTVRFISISLDYRKIGTLLAMDIKTLPIALDALNHCYRDFKSNKINNINLVSKYCNELDCLIPNSQFEVVSCKTVSCDIEKIQFVRTDAVIKFEKKVESFKNAKMNATIPVDDLYDSSSMDWGFLMNIKYNMIEKRKHITRSILYSIIIRELTGKYGIDIEKLRNDYIEKYNPEKYYVMQSIANNPDARHALEQVVDGMLLKYNLVEKSILENNNNLETFTKIINKEDI